MRYQPSVVVVLGAQPSGVRCVPGVLSTKPTNGDRPGSITNNLLESAPLGFFRTARLDPRPDALWTSGVFRGDRGASLRQAGEESRWTTGGIESLPCVSEVGPARRSPTVLAGDQLIQRDELAPVVAAHG